MKKTVIFLLVIFILLFSVTTFAQANEEVYHYSNLITNSLKYTYKNVISPVNQSSCSMYPTCSGYAANAFNKENKLIAWLKTSDRLIRCSNDPQNYNRTLVDGMIRFYDPVNYQLGDYSFPNKKNNFIDISENNDSDLTNANAKLLYDFAEKLKYEGNIEKSITEYKRLISYYPDSKYKGKAFSSVFSLLYQDSRYLEAIEWGDRIKQESDSSLNYVNLNFYIGTSFFRLENYKRAKEYFDKVRESNNNDLIAKTHLIEGIGYIVQEKWDKAKSSFAKVDAESAYYNKSQEFINLSNEGNNLDLKDPKLAGVLGVIPGLGYLYSGYKQTAASSLFVNSLFFWATSQSFEKDNKGLGTLLGVFSFGFYSGNIHGSVETAKRKNDLIKQNHINKFNLGFEF
jgi:putative component of membrane protein insertase Oxa1/YidC/SpoIIIJ protein YidD/TolA-binding protein